MGFLDSFFGGKPDKATFAADAIKRLKAGGETRPITYEPKRDQLVIGDPASMVNFVFLENFYNEYCTLPKNQRDGVFERMKPTAEMLDSTFEQAQRGLIPRVRERTYASLLALRMEMQMGERPKTLSLPHQVLGEHFAVSVGIDYPTVVADVTSQELDKWHTSLEVLMPIALKNLRAMSTEPFQQPRPGVFVSPWRDSHDPARLLLTDVMSKLPVKGNPVAAIPNRTSLIITGSQDAPGLDELITLTKMGLKDPRPLSSFLITLENGVWVPFHPAPGSPLSTQLSVLSAQARLGSHAEQKEIFTKTQQHADYFIATLNAVQAPGTGEVITVCSWTEGVPSLLPMTDEIALVVLSADLKPEKTKVTRIPIATVKREVGHLLEPMPGLFPPRWKVERFPTEEEISRMV